MLITGCDEHLNVINTRATYKYAIRSCRRHEQEMVAEAMATDITKHFYKLIANSTYEKSQNLRVTEIFVRTHIIVNSTPDQQLIFRTFKNLRWRTAAILKNRKCSTNEIINSLLRPGNKTANINVKNCSLYTLLTATDRKPQKS